MNFVNELTNMCNTVNSKQFSKYIKSRLELSNWIYQQTDQYNPQTLNERIWIILNSPPIICVNGNKPVFNTFNLGYRNGCGSSTVCKCNRDTQAKKISNWQATVDTNLRKELQEKAKITLFKNYGVDNPMKSKEIIEKYKNNNQKKYGVDYPLLSEEISNKISATNLKKYGVTRPLQSEEIQQKSKNSSMQKYGKLMTHARKAAYEKYDGQNPFTNKEVKEKIIKTNIEKYGHARALDNSKIYSKGISTNLEKYDRPNVMQTNIDDKLWNILSNKETFLKLIDGKTSTQISEILNVDTNTVIKWVKRHNLISKIIFNPNSAMEQDIKNWMDDIKLEYQQHNRKILSNNLELDFY